MTDAQALVVDLAEVPAAREAYENYAWSYQDIANEFGISRQRVREIVSA